MKGRIIGREGRNIRAFESATGINVLIDDTPQAVVLSGFDPVRRELARQTLERLVLDGRINPARIEEEVAKVKEELETSIHKAGEEAVLRVGLQKVHPEVMKLLGRLKFRHSFAQNVLDHSIEVAAIEGMLAAELGLNQQIAKRVGLFHDIGKAVDHEVEGSHAMIGAEFLKKCGERGGSLARCGLPSPRSRTPHDLRSPRQRRGCHQCITTRCAQREHGSVPATPREA